MIRILLAGVLAAVIAIGALGYRLSKANSRALAAQTQAQEYLGSLNAANAALEAHKKSAAARQATLDNRAKIAQAQGAKANKENHDLRTQLEAHSEWASTPIPDGVRESLAP